MKVRCPNCSHTILNCLCSPDMIDDARNKNDKLMETIYDWFGGKIPTASELYYELVKGKNAQVCVDNITDIIKAWDDKSHC